MESVYGVSIKIIKNSSDLIGNVLRIIISGIFLAKKKNLPYENGIFSKISFSMAKNDKFGMTWQPWSQSQTHSSSAKAN